MGWVAKWIYCAKSRILAAKPFQEPGNDLQDGNYAGDGDE